MLMSMLLYGGHPSLINSCFVRITSRMSLKCPSLSFSVASSLIFYALICWILLLWLDVRPRGHQRGTRAVSDAVVLDVPFYPEPDKIEWSDLENRTIRFGGYRELAPASILVSAFTSRTLSYSAATSSGPFSASGFSSPLAEELLLSSILP
jgi:hypothetical protein